MHISMGAVSLELEHLDTGAWFISSLSYDGRCITGAGSADYAAGWEISLNGFRYTPHVAEIIAGDVERIECAPHIELILKNNTVDGTAQINQHLRLSSLRQTGVLESWIEVVNTSDHELILSNVNFTQLKLSSSFMGDLEVWHNYGQSVSPVTDNYFELHDPAVFLHQASADWGLVVVNMAPAQMYRISTGTYTSIGYSNGVCPFAYHLAAGACFVSDRAAVIPYAGSVARAGQSAIYDYTRQILRDDQALAQPLTYCSWEPFARDIDESRISEQIQQADDLGFECFIIDDGWQLHAGDWTADPKKFPGGLQVIAEDIHQRGMQLGLWISLATISAGADASTAFDDCIIRSENGKRRETHVFEGTLGIACMATRFASYIESRLCDLISQLDLRYIKIDLPVVYDVYHRPAILCYAEGHDHAPGWDYTLKAYRAIQDVSRTLKKKFPALVVDLTFELWGGWHAIDPALIGCADVCWLSNLSDISEEDNGPCQARHLAASRSRIIPPQHQVVGNLRCNGAYPLESVASSFAYYPMLLGDLSKMSEQDRIAQRQLFAWFKAQENRCDLTAHYAVLTEVDSESHLSKNTYSGFLRCDFTGNGILGIFRNRSPLAQAIVPLVLPVEIADSAEVKLIAALTTPEGKTSPQSYTAGDVRKGLLINLEDTHDFILYAVHVK